MKRDSVLESMDRIRHSIRCSSRRPVLLPLGDIALKASIFCSRVNPAIAAKSSGRHGAGGWFAGATAPGDEENSTRKRVPAHSDPDYLWEAEPTCAGRSILQETSLLLTKPSRLRKHLAARRFAGALRSRGSLAVLARSGQRAAGL